MADILVTLYSRCPGTLTFANGEKDKLQHQHSHELSHEHELCYVYTGKLTFANVCILEVLNALARQTTAMTHSQTSVS